MYRVIDTIEYRREWFQRRPEMADHEEGVFAILDPEQVRGASLPQVKQISVVVADGSEWTLDVSSIKVGAGDIVGLFFRDKRAEVVPRVR